MHGFISATDPIDVQMQIQEIANTIMGMADSIRKITGDLEKLKASTPPCCGHVKNTDKKTDGELEKRYYGCLDDILSMAISYKGNHYVISRDFFDYCHAKRLQPTMFRNWLYKKGYIAGRAENGKILKTKITYLGDVSKRTRCMVLLGPVDG